MRQSLLPQGLQPRGGGLLAEHAALQVDPGIPIIYIYMYINISSITIIYIYI